MREVSHLLSLVLIPTKHLPIQCCKNYGMTYCGGVVWCNTLSSKSQFPLWTEHGLDERGHNMWQILPPLKNSCHTIYL